MILSNK